MTTRLGIRTQLRAQLSDTTIWPDTSLDIWIRDAIRDYSQHFPRPASTTVTCTTARVYSLAAYDVIALLAVEYPTGDDPPTYLSRLNESAAAFRNNPYYDLRGDDLVLGQTPTAGQIITIRYQTTHTAPVTDATALTVPDEHLDLLRLFCLWQAAKLQEMTEAQEPDTLSTLMTMYSMNVVRAERAYRSRLKDYQTRAQSGITPAWRMDKWDRTY